MSLKEILGIQNPLQKFIGHYKINSINPNITCTKLEYQLVLLENEMKYKTAMSLLVSKDLRPATYLELLHWDGWDMKSQVIACGSLRRGEGEMHAYQLISLDCCEMDSFGKKMCRVEKCFKLLNVNSSWYKGAYLLGVREI